MKKMIFKCSIGVILMLFSFNLLSQNPTYKCRIENAAQVSCNVYEFDVVLQRTGTNILKLAMFQLGIQINSGLIPAGARVDLATVPGSSQLNTSQQLPDERFSFDTLTNAIVALPVYSLGVDNATVISNYYTGTRLFRLRVASSLPFNAGFNTNHEWSFSLLTGYPTRIFAYVGTNITDVTVQSSHTITTPGGNITMTNTGFSDPLVQTVFTDNYEYCIHSGNYPMIFLTNAQSGHTYYLYKNDTLIDGPEGVCFGNDSMAAFGYHATEGIYTAKSTSCSGTIDMLESVQITNITPIVPEISVSWSPPSYNCVYAGDSITFTANPLYGGDSPFYQWYIDNVPVSNELTFTFLPLHDFSIYCEMLSSEICVTSALVTSDTFAMSVVHRPPMQFMVGGGGTVCQGDTAYITLSGSEAGINYWISTDTLHSCPHPGSNCQALTGTGLPLTWAVTGAGTYYVLADGFKCTEAPPLPNRMAGTALVIANPVYLFTENHSICSGNELNWHGNNYSMAGNYRVNYTTNAGCDSIYILNLTVNPVYAFTEKQSVCEGEQFQWHNQVFTTGGTYTANYQTKYGCDSIYTLNLNFNPVDRTLEIKAFLEGLYADSSRMKAVMGLTGPEFGTDIADEVSVEFHEANAPYGTMYYRNDVELSTHGILTIRNLECSLNDLFYIVIKHRSSIDTWSSLPQDLAGSGPFAYDFSVAASQAYGNNLKPVGNIFAIWGADASRDGIVDGTDMALVDNASKPPPTMGYHPEDVNGDGIVDGSDMAMIDNNSKPPPAKVDRP